MHDAAAPPRSRALSGAGVEAIHGVARLRYVGGENARDGRTAAARSGSVNHAVDQVQAPVARVGLGQLDRRHAILAVGHADPAQLAIVHQHVENAALFVDDRRRIEMVGAAPAGTLGRRQLVGKAAFPKRLARIGVQGIDVVFGACDQHQLLRALAGLHVLDNQRIGQRGVEIDAVGNGVELCFPEQFQPRNVGFVQFVFGARPTGSLRVGLVGEPFARRRRLPGFPLPQLRQIALEHSNHRLHLFLGRPRSPRGRHALHLQYVRRVLPGRGHRGHTGGVLQYLEVDVAGSDLTVVAGLTILLDERPNGSNECWRRCGIRSRRRLRK